MNVNQAIKLDDIINVWEIDSDDPNVRYFRAALYANIKEGYTKEYWNSLSKQQQEFHLQQLKYTLKRWLLNLVCNEVETEPNKCMCLDGRFLIILTENEMSRLARLTKND